MAPATYNIKTMRLVWLILVIGISVASSGEYSGLLSKLYKKAAQQNRPLILVLDNSLNAKSRDKPQKYSASEEYGVDNLELLNLNLLDQKRTPKYKSFKFLKPYRDDYDADSPRHQHHDRTQQLRYRDDDSREGRDRRDDDRREDRDRRDYDRREDRYRQDDDRRDEDRRENRFRSKDRLDEALRNPVLKSLLRIPKSLQCEAKNKCQDKCSNKFIGKKLKKCERNCEKKFNCVESEKDPCEDGSCELTNECGGSSEDKCQGSTKGEMFVTETPKCKRC